MMRLHDLDDAESFFPKEKLQRWAGIALVIGSIIALIFVLPFVLNHLADTVRAFHNIKQALKNA